ncbi:ABC transporter ATP-binding protein [Streptomyces sp. NPDC059071]
MSQMPPRLPENALVVLIGRSGVGKSTLACTLAGLPDTSGAS